MCMTCFGESWPFGRKIVLAKAKHISKRHFHYQHRTKRVVLERRSRLLLLLRRWSASRLQILRSVDDQEFEKIRRKFCFFFLQKTSEKILFQALKSSSINRKIENPDDRSFHLLRLLPRAASDDTSCLFNWKMQNTNHTHFYKLQM